MRAFHPVSRTVACAVLSLVCSTAAIAVVAAAQTPGPCPPIIASLLPKNGSALDGQYIKGGEGGDFVIRGSGSADIPFEHRCITQSKFPAHISIKVDYFGGEMVMLFEMAGDAPNEEIISSAIRELEQHKRTLNSTLSDPKREKLAGGEIAYTEYMSECPSKEQVMADIGEMALPNVMLTGVISTKNARLEVSLKGQISVEAAKAAVTEVFENLKKADFSKVR